MKTREEYLAAIERDLKRIQGNIDEGSPQRNNDGATVKATVGNTTTEVKVPNKKIGNISVSIGCFDFSRANPRIPDGIYVDGVRVDEDLASVKPQLK